MTHVVTEACIKCKYMDCVEVCPVNCFHEGENMLAIDPDRCIDCGVCIPECPINAIIPDTDPQAVKWVEHNRTYANQWPTLSIGGVPPADADQWKNIPDKMQYFSPASGKGD